MNTYSLRTSITTILLILFTLNLTAQYFGRNKAQYETFDFEVYKSPHFEFYHYLEDKEKLNDVAQWTEHWYHAHQEVLQDTFTERNPFILYNNHGHFQQTRAISGAVGVTTGGVTEGLKNRVILPFGMTNQQSHHVIGHELVHAFQYHLVINGDSTSLRNMANFPLWFVEGLAEYMSIGKVDAHTAMWMRDAVLHDDVPTLKAMTRDFKYFPYRYGQAFWAFVAGFYGDNVIRPYFEETAKRGIAEATKLVLETDIENLSSMFQGALKTYYSQILGEAKKENFIGKKLLHEGNTGRMNISPSISPNGRYVIFLSEKNLFTTDLFLADARSGEVLNKVASTVKDGHIDAFSYFESAGTWSPDSKKFAFVGFSKGKNIILVKEAKTGKTVDEILIPNVPSITSPAWSPDGKMIVFVGMVEGQTDLYAYNFKSKTTTRLTDDVYSELQPSFSPDGSKLVFSTDKVSQQKGRVLGKWKHNISIMNMETKNISNLKLFRAANNLNPVFDNENNILFLSNQDGFRNIYKYESQTGNVLKLTNFLVGVSGISEYAPAITVARKRDRVLFSLFNEHKYVIYQADKEDFLAEEVALDSVDYAASTLPPVGLEQKDIINENLAGLDEVEELPESDFSEDKYRPKFQLDYISGGGGVAVGNSNAFGTATGLAGGINMLFGDVLGNNQLFANLAMNGEIYDFGGQLAYVNQKNRIAWGVSYSHIPYLATRSYGTSLDSLQDQAGNIFLANKLTFDKIRFFEDRVGVFASLPFSSTMRVEGGASYSRNYYRIDRNEVFFDDFGQTIFREEEKIDAPDGYNLFNLNAAWVGDNSYFGFASPLQGYRYRLGAEQYFGRFNFTSLTADYRRYFYMKPFSIAVRGMHYGRYGGDLEGSNLNNIYIGNPVLVRGYSYDNLESIIRASDTADASQFVGSKVLVGNLEVRLPLTGPKALAVIKSGFLFTELALFADAGVAWEEFSDFDNDNSNISNLAPEPAYSVGAALRVNLFGALILEPFYAWPLHKDTKGTFGLNIVPGW